MRFKFIVLLISLVSVKYAQGAETVSLFGANFSCTACEVFQSENDCYIELELEGRVLGCEAAFKEFLINGKLIGSNEALNQIISNEKLSIDLRKLAFNEKFKTESFKSELRINLKVPSVARYFTELNNIFESYLKAAPISSQNVTKQKFDENPNLFGISVTILVFLLISFIGIKQVKNELIKKDIPEENSELAQFELPRLLERFGLPLNASCEDLRKRFSKLAIELNPDRTPENTAEFRAAYADFKKAKELLKSVGAP